MDYSGDRTLAERAFGAIHEGIVNGTYAPGARLRIEELAATLRISPTPIREALHRLQALGLAEHIPHRGARVTDLNPEDLRDLYEARLALEPLAVGRAARNFGDEDAKTARRFLEQLTAAEKKNDFTDAWKAHTGFHFTLYKAGHSAWLIRLITPLWERSQCYRLQWETIKADLKRRNGEHLSILEACIAGDVDRATNETYNHLARTANAIAQEMSKQAFLELRPLDSARANAKPTGRDRSSDGPGQLLQRSSRR